MRILLVVATLAVSAVMFTALAHAQVAPTPTPTPTVSPTPVPTVSVEEQAQQEHLLKQRMHKLRKRIRRDQKATWHWQDIMLKRHTRPAKPVAHISSLNWLQHVAKYWHKRRLHVRRLAHHPPHLWLWLCIHRQEAPWRNPGVTWDGRPSRYFGGLQMGEWFMWRYAPRLRIRRGRANNWPPLQQIWVAERAFKREGYSRTWLLGQWVPTASHCI